MTDQTRFALPFRWIHWIMATLILMMLIAGQGFGNEMADADRMTSLTGHSSLGSLVVILLILRIFFRLSGRANRPSHPDLPGWMDFGSKSVQAGIYLLMIYLPVTGILAARAHSLPVRPFGLMSISTSDPMRFEAMRNLHDYGTKALMLLLLAHIGAALFHRFIRRDGVMAVMSLFPARKSR